jgi:O-methyltransferase
MELVSLAIYARKLFSQFGLDIARQDTQFLEPEFVKYLKLCEPFTMVSRERLYAQFQAINYVLTHHIEGDIVECGVWKGGTSMLGAMTLLGRQDTSRRVWLYDTFAGMTEPTDADVSPWDGNYARQIWSANREGDHNKWCFSPLEEVKRNFLSTGYPEGRVNFVKGDVAETLLQHVPDKIAVLRLDTDWYESTKAEMEILYPRLSKGGVILIDDYGAWAGAKKAVDEYITTNKVPLMLHRTDYTGRSAIKVSD